MNSEGISRFISSNRSIHLSHGVLIVVGGTLAVEEKERRKLRKSEAIWAIVAEIYEL